MENNQSNKKKKRVIATVITVIVLIVTNVTAFRAKLNTPLNNEGSSVINESNLLTGGIKNTDLKAEKIIDGDSKGQIILSLPIKGTISGEKSSIANEYDQELLLMAVEEARVNDNVAGIILDIDSGGGAVYHSAELYNALAELKEEKDIPIYSSIGSMGCSGAYYIAMASDEIYAQTESTIGSIGVISSSLNAEKLLEKIGLEYNVFTTGDYKDTGSFYRDLTDEENKYIDERIDRIYERFIDVVCIGRQMDEDEALKVADGKVFDGSLSLEHNLIDEIGDYEDTYLAMSEKIGQNFDVVELKRKSSAIESLIPDSLSGLVNHSKYKSEAGEYLELLEKVKEYSQPIPMYYYNGGSSYE